MTASHIPHDSAAQGARRAPDLKEFSRRYPLTVRNFGTLAEREAWLRRIWELEARWNETMERAARQSNPPEVVMHCAPPAGAVVEAGFDIIYAGGVLGLLHAAVMATRFDCRVLVFDAHTVGRTHRDWNISDEELKEFERAGLFTIEELQQAVTNRYTNGFVKFHDGASRVKAPPLWMDGVLDVALDADKLLALAVEKIKRHAPAGCAMRDGLRFNRIYVEPHRVTVEVTEERAGTAKRRWFQARLFVDATGTNSPVAAQLNDERGMTHVCPTVGTVARGFVRGQLDEQPRAVDFNVGEILVSTEDAGEHSQLIWEGFAGNPVRDDYTTYLFFYDAVDSKADKSLLALFENYFERLPDYKQAGAGWRVAKPVFGYIPSFHQQGWRRRRKRTAADRVLLVGDAAGLSSPITFCGFGSHVRNLRRLTEATNKRLAEDALDANSLVGVNAYEARVAQMASLAEFMRPVVGNRNPAAVNETMNAVMSALHGLDERVRRELFQDRMTFHALRQLLGGTARLYPTIFRRVREHLGARGTFWWLAGIAEAVWSERREGGEASGEVDLRVGQAAIHHRRQESTEGAQRKTDLES
jgi:lycopene cyclase CruA